MTSKAVLLIAGPVDDRLDSQANRNQVAAECFVQNVVALAFFVEELREANIGGVDAGVVIVILKDSHYILRSHLPDEHGCPPVVDQCAVGAYGMAC